MKILITLILPISILLSPLSARSEKLPTLLCKIIKLTRDDKGVYYLTSKCIKNTLTD